ncbi:sensor histidine kinase [Spongiactinospora sp. 9N601]|uniref:sensor histidine kinase n=1 Tax=Spongiactinospora sp. 9N601 TaxID=3375149 RepID=UPI0037A1EF56
MSRTLARGMPAVVRVLLSADQPPAARRPGLRGACAWAVVHANELCAVALTITAYTYARDALSFTVFPASLVFVTSVALAAGQAAPLALRRSYPLGAWTVLITTFLACCLLEQALELAPGRLSATANLVGPLVLYRVGLTRPPGPVLAVTGVTMTAFLALRTELNPAGVVLLIGVAALFGGLMAARGRTESDLAQHRRAHALLSERARIARELHDVVAHHMSIVAVQAETAPYRIDGLAPRVAAEFESLAKGARMCLSEMRRLLGALRDENTAAELTPQPGLAELGELAVSVRRTGSPVEIDIDDSAGALPPVHSLVVYRIVQEAWSNVVRHAPGAPVRTRVERRGGDVYVEVANGPPPRLPGRVPRLDGSALGLRGIRERAQLLGGTLHAGPVDGGGFVVKATLPVREAAG